MIKNEEGYADPTYDGAYKTIRQEEKRKQDEADAARMDKAIHKAREIFKWMPGISGFHKPENGFSRCLFWAAKNLILPI